MKIERYTPANEELVEYRKHKNTIRRKKIVDGYDHIVYATDQDLDGFHIRALLSGFIKKYLFDYSDYVGMLETPVIAVFKDGKIQRWTYSLDDRIEVKNNEISFYYKGLGSWNKDDFKTVIKQDGLDKMIEPLSFNYSNKILDEWLGSSSDVRKQYILKNDFNIEDV